MAKQVILLFKNKITRDGKVWFRGENYNGFCLRKFRSQGL